MFTRSSTPVIHAALTLALLLMLVLPSTATAEPEVVERQVFQTTGAEMALGMLADVRGLEVDRSGVTVSIDQAGVVHPVRVELAGLLGLDPVHSDEVGGGSFVRLGTLLVAATILFRVVRALARLGREET